ncbi:hypothetical protein LAZ67_17000846 [Cordylochernes scorpioides]|uniref:RNA-directed DNA polymerase n=1 Tax=Cordylochernes scorpioides TaxID=51811 RepID=A0ABY6LDA0_9ARAC|nr:hypothetical protein LAZ67_17000846 [Cordylochernes scorpioides]
MLLFNVNGVTIKAFLDPGSSIDLIRKSVLDKYQWKSVPSKTKLTTINQNDVFSSECIDLELEIDNHKIKVTAIVLEDMAFEILIGKPTMKKFRIKWDFGTDDIKCFSLRSREVVATIDDLRTKFPELCHTSKKKFPKSEVDFLLKPNNNIVACKPYPMSDHKRRWTARKIEELLARGIITRSNSEYASPCILVPKKDSSYRLCIDYRRLNQETFLDPFPFPRIDTIINQFGGCQYFTKIDLKDSFWQVGLTKATRRFSAFATPDGLYEFTRLPFGWKNSPPKFQGVISEILDDLLERRVVVYLDDICCGAPTLDECASLTYDILHRLNKFNMTLIDIITSKPILAIPDESLPYELYTDASYYGTGAVLYQRDVNKKKPHQLRVISYYSYTFSRAEQNYSITEKECLAVLKAVKHLRFYLEGKPFVVHTDHRALTQLLSCGHLRDRLARWQLFLSSFEMKVNHRSGRELSDADALSRLAIEIPNDNSQAVLFFKHRSIPLKLENYTKYFVPDEHRTSLLSLYHDDPLSGGHSGFWRTYYKMKQRFSWRGMKNDIRKYVASCPTCQNIKFKYRCRPSRMSLPSQSRVPYHTVHIDFAEAPSGVKDKKSTFLLVIDEATSLPELLPSCLPIKNSISSVTFMKPKKTPTEQNQYRQRTKLYFNRRNKTMPPELKIGDFILVRHQRVGKEWHQTGPHRVTELSIHIVVTCVLGLTLHVSSSTEDEEDELFKSKVPSKPAAAAPKSSVLAALEPKYSGGSMFGDLDYGGPIKQNEAAEFLVEAPEKKMNRLLASTTQKYIEITRNELYNHKLNNELSSGNFTEHLLKDRQSQKLVTNDVSESDYRDDNWLSEIIAPLLDLESPRDARTCIKFCVKNEIKCADAFRMLTVAYGEAALDRSNVYRWYKMFSEGREDVNDEERAGRPSTSTTDEKINEVEKMILANRRITVREVAEDLNISIVSCHSIFINDLGMRRVAAKFVPKLLNCDQKQHRMDIANEMLDSVRDDPNLLQRVITGDEAWVYGYDVETKAQSSQWKLPHEPRPKKARQVRSNVKVLLTVFFDCRGVVHHEFLPQGRTVNKEYYLQVMRNLREAIRQKRPDLWKNKNGLLHHDNPSAHTSLLVRDFLAKNNTLMMPQPPYSPDLTPCDFFLFPKLKRPMKGRRYATLDEIKTASKEELKKILKNDFLKCFEDWKNRWKKLCIEVLADPRTSSSIFGRRAAGRCTLKKITTGSSKRIVEVDCTSLWLSTFQFLGFYKKRGLKYLALTQVTPELLAGTYPCHIQLSMKEAGRFEIDSASLNYLLVNFNVKKSDSPIYEVFWIVFDFYLLKKMDQRTCIKFCVKNEIKCADAFRMLTVAYGEATLDRSNVYRWYKMFSEGREDVNDEERAGRPSTSTTDEKINEVEKMILANRRITVREVAEDLNISIGSCHSIFINDLGMRRVAAKFVPKLLNCDQKQHRMNIANEMLNSVRDDPNLLQRVITGDEAWVYGYDVETKSQSSQWKLPQEPRPKKARQVRSNVKVLLTVFFDCRGVVHHEFLPQGRTVNKEYYLQVMRKAIRQKRPDLWKNKNWFLHHDNTPAHTSLLVRDFLAKNNTLMMPQPPYSPDLPPCDFFLFPKLKRPMKGRRYATLDEIKTASKEELKKILKSDFLKCFEDWKNRWHKCIISHGDYFEGDKIGIHE